MQIHRQNYAWKRPTTPNTTNAPLGLAPLALVTVYLTGTTDLAAITTDVNGTTALANPFTADINGYYEYYANSVAGDVDEQLSGGGIVSPYTLTAVLGIDPSIGTLQLQVTSIQADLTSEIAARIAGDLAITQTGIRYPLGGSVQMGLQSASRMAAFDAQMITIDGGKFVGYVLTVFCQGRTDDAGTSFQPVLRNITNAVDAGSGTVSTSITNVTQSFTATINPAVNQYQLQIEPGNAASFLYLEGYAELSVP